MPMFRGNAWQIGLGHQVAEGTALNPTLMYRWLDGSGVNPTVKMTPIFEGDGGIDATFMNKDSSLWAGKLKFYPRPVDMGQILCAISGTSSETLKSAPSGAAVAAVAGGSIPNGVYHYAYANVYGKVEGPLSADLTFTSATTNQTASFTGVTIDPDATKIRLWKGLIAGASGTYTQYTDITPAVTFTDTGTVPTFTPLPSNLTGMYSPSGKVHLFKPASYADFWTTEFGQVITAAGAPSNQIRLQAADCVSKTLTLTMAPNMPVTAEYDFIGKYATVVAALQVAVFDTTASRPYIMSNATFAINGALNTTVEKAVVKIDLTLEENVMTAAAIYPYSIAEDRRTVTADFDLVFQDASLFWQFVDGGVSSNPTAGTIVDSPGIATGTLDFNLLAGGVDGTQAMGITINNINYLVKPINPNLQGKHWQQPCSGQAMKSALPLYTAQVHNTQATAY